MSENNNEIEKKLFEIIGLVFKCDLKDLNMETTLRKDLQAKSINFIEISAMVEKHFHHEIRVNKMMEVVTIRDIQKLIQER